MIEIGLISHTVNVGDGQGRANYEIVHYALKQGAKVRVIADDIAPDLLPLVDFYPVTMPAFIRKINLLKVFVFAKKADSIAKKWNKEGVILHACGYCTGIEHDINTSQYVHTAWKSSAYHASRVSRNLYGLYHWAYSFFNSIWEKSAYHKSKIVVSASGTVRNELESLIGIPESQLVIINNGADIKEFYPGEDVDHTLRKALNLTEDTVLGLFAGDLRTPRKNLDSVLKALAQVPNLHLAVVGRPEGSPFPALAQLLGLEDRVHFLGFRRDIAAIMRACDFFVFPSRYEACALVLSEAAASGLPIITAKTTGGAEVVSPGAGIFLDDPNDISALKSALQIMAQEPQKRLEMREIARAHYTEQSWDKIGKAYYDLYCKMWKA